MAAQNLAVGLAYFLLSELVLLPRFGGGMTATPIWPGDGIVVAAVWLLGPRILPGVALAASIVLAQRSPLLMALVASAAPVLNALVAVHVLRLLKFDDRLERVRDPLVLSLVAAPAGSVVAATVGVTAAWLFGGLPGGGVGFGWLLWLMRDWLGVATVAPLVFAWLRARPMPSERRRLLEGAVLLIGLLGAAQVIIGLWSATQAEDVPVAFVVLPFVAWAGLRFGARGASSVVAIVAALATGIAVLRIGPVRGLGDESTHTVTFMFLLLAAVAGQVLAGMKAERDDARQKRLQLEEQLRHSQKMEAVGRLVGGIAHDFNNLLTAIIGYADVVVNGLDPKDPRRPDAEQISRAAMRAAELTRQMLSFSRRQAVQNKVVNLNTTLAKVEPMLRRVIGEDIKLTISPKSAQPLARVDAGQMEQVIMNLAVNARDAMPKGGRLTIETADVELDEDTAADTRDAKPGSFVMLSVSDTGVGMSAVVRARLFEPYFTTKDVGKGTGLGLSTVYGIVRQGEGHVTVASEVGQGTTFRVMLPRAEAEAAADGDTSVQKLPGGTEHVLLVEDDASVRRLARDLLTRLGYSVTESASGRAGLALGSDDTRHFDLAVCDVLLGDMSGPSVVEALRALRPTIRVLYMSGHTDDAIVRTGVLEEGKPFLQKPFTPVQLARKIREVLEDRETDAA